MKKHVMTLYVIERKKRGKVRVPTGANQNEPDLDDVIQTDGHRIRGR